MGNFTVELKYDAGRKLLMPCINNNAPGYITNRTQYDIIKG